MNHPNDGSSRPPPRGPVFPVSSDTSDVAMTASEQQQPRGPQYLPGQAPPSQQQPPQQYPPGYMYGPQNQAPAPFTGQGNTYPQSAGYPPASAPPPWFFPAPAPLPSSSNYSEAESSGRAVRGPERGG